MKFNLTGDQWRDPRLHCQTVQGDCNRRLTVHEDHVVVVLGLTVHEDHVVVVLGCSHHGFLAHLDLGLHFPDGLELLGEDSLADRLGTCIKKTDW